jgi:hypothetical protein
MSMFNAFWYLNAWSFQEDTLLVLLLKKSEATKIEDYQPISLIHMLQKLFSKVLAIRLAPRLEELVHVSQNIFVKGRFIQDSFKLVQATTKVLHSKRKASLLFKVDIARAFNSVS